MEKISTLERDYFAVFRFCGLEERPPFAPIESDALQYFARRGWGLITEATEHTRADMLCPGCRIERKGKPARREKLPKIKTTRHGYERTRSVATRKPRRKA